jgi:hypothetical protein
VLADSKLAAPEELRVLESLTTPEIEPLAPEIQEGDDGESHDEGGVK